MEIVAQTKTSPELNTVPDVSLAETSKGSVLESFAETTENNPAENIGHVALFGEDVDSAPKQYLADNFPDEYGALHEALKEGEVAELDKFIEARTAEALRDCEFQETPELRESLAGFYKDHFYLAGAIKAIVEGKYDSGILEKIQRSSKEMKQWEIVIGSKMPLPGDAQYRLSPNAAVASYRIAKMAKEFSSIKEVLSEEQASEWQFNILKQCGVAINDNLFSETSIGITTIGDSEVVLAQELAESTKEIARGRKIYDVPRATVTFPSAKDVGYKIEGSIARFWEDTRHAGQLEFHGSTDIGGINLYGLMSRNSQYRITGMMNAQTMLTWGRDSQGRQTMHSVVPHFSEFYGGGEYSVGDKGGTLAIPLVKIIREAPFARDAHYGLLMPKNAGTLDRVPDPTLEQPTGRVGAGRSDQVSAIGPDRVFFASPDETSASPDDYVVRMYDKEELPATYIVDRTLYGHNAERELHNLGLGHGSPERLIIESQKSAAELIRALQETYKRAYAKYGIVVPLRRGVFGQVFENVPVEEMRGRNTATMYNRYVNGSEKKTA